jgi:ketosteroid isomerase-like protein
MSDPSPKPIDVVNGVQAAYEQGDEASALALIAPEVEWIEPEGFPGADTWHGRDGVRKAMARFWGTWADPVSEYRDMQQIENRVFVCLHIRARGRESGAPGEFDVFQVWTIRDGMAARVEHYLDRDNALRAAGLAPTEKEVAQ